VLLLPLPYEQNSNGSNNKYIGPKWHNNLANCCATFDVRTRHRIVDIWQKQSSNGIEEGSHPAFTLWQKNNGNLMPTIYAWCVSDG